MAPLDRKRAVLEKLRIERVPMPMPEPEEIRVRLDECGVCSSNLEPWAGPEWVRFPTEPGGSGHEGWGTVDAVGRDVDGISIGDWVAALFTHSYAEFDISQAAKVVRGGGRLIDLMEPDDEDE